VPKKSSKPVEKSLVDHWPEILEDINLSAIPIIYLDSIISTFEDGNVWNVSLSREDRQNSSDISRTLNDLFENYGPNIEHVDFRLDIEKIKKDVIKSTKKFLKRKK
jgi:hypothetical protein